MLRTTLRLALAALALAGLSSCTTPVAPAGSGDRGQGAGGEGYGTPAPRPLRPGSGATEPAVILTGPDQPLAGTTELDCFVVCDDRRPVDLRAEWSADRGATWQRATLRFDERTAGLTGLASAPLPGVRHRLRWDAGADLAGTTGAAFLHVYPRGSRGRGGTLQVALANAAVPAEPAGADAHLVRFQEEEAPPAAPPPPAPKIAEPKAVSFSLAHELDLKGCWPGEMVAADFDKDGKLDLVIGDRNYGMDQNREWAFVVRVYKGLGNGKLDEQHPVHVFVNGPVGGVKAADLDGDGHLDLVVSCAGEPTVSENSINVFRGDSRFGFTRWGAGGQPVGYFPISNSKEASTLFKPVALDVADVNGDGKLDVVTANMQHDSVRDRDHNWSCLLQNQAGVFYAPIHGGTLNYFVTSIRAGDVNNDGKADIAIGNQGDVGFLSVGLGDGAGRFIHAAYQTERDHGMNGNNPQFVEIADVNGDGWRDLVCAGKKSGISVFLNDGTGKFHPGVIVDPEDVAGGGTAIAAADFNRDGAIDFVVTHAGDLFATVFYGKPIEGQRQGSGRFVGPSTLSAPANWLGMGVAVGDFNGDGKPDFAAGLARPTDQQTLGKIRVYVQK